MADSLGIDASQVAAYIAEQSGEPQISDTEPVVTNEPVPGMEPENNVVVEGAPDPDGTTPDPVVDGALGEDPDLSDLDPEVRVLAEQRIRELRGDYTRKTQEIAHIRKMADEYAGGDVEAMRQALEFTHRLQTDPGFRESLYNELRGVYDNGTGQAGITPDQDEFDDDDIPSGLQTRLSQMEQRLQQYEAQARQAEQEAHQQHLIEQAAADLERQMSAIRKVNPDIKDNHVEQIYMFGHVTNGDLVAAEALWRQMRNEAQAELIAAKRAIPSSISAGSPGANAGAPEKPLETLEEAGQAALEYIRAHSQQ